eukprot:gnl/TRDRNA2_/TRDRNA2_54726_c0_seq1.p2 gnl/TRDRNA2_/TRDRNA2_54726_c0~~gnl/TRDRNA2_/TRDRNA2_54726_c0_seq1.p2  ORF type:complete len:165 (+),score=16.20 gnl/TRDRNA2_/TRDRNA2_54726_c0_seq1:150-644(+)
MVANMPMYCLAVIFVVLLMPTTSWPAEADEHESTCTMHSEMTTDESLHCLLQHRRSREVTNVTAEKGTDVSSPEPAVLQAEKLISSPPSLREISEVANFSGNKTSSDPVKAVALTDAAGVESRASHAKREEGRPGFSETALFFVVILTIIVVLGTICCIMVLSK